MAEQLLKVKAGLLHNEPDAILHSNGKTDIDCSGAVLNKARISGNKSVLINGFSLVNQMRTGEIISLGKLTLEIVSQLRQCK